MANFKIEKINTIIIPVKDLNRSIDFYKNVLHLTEDFVENGMAYFSVGQGEDEISIMLHIIDEPEPVEKGIVFELMTEDVVAAVESIKNVGEEIVQEPVDREWGVTEAVIADPDGYRIWVVQPLS
ncbi:VOC family protein [Virgibacillus sp. NKC19-16]|uniref:VOC family protein n=1 Tax=Virgibacillus salidurans TaxID=2831673 RepID=UPI001F1DC80F|nr:VOC family protein [Virgibacillus sp. NKC19-16]UJL45269.1 VOC family protein [Virgibacillus sp. NKC19-16]